MSTSGSFYKLLSGKVFSFISTKPLAVSVEVLCLVLCGECWLLLSKKKIHIAVLSLIGLLPPELLHSVIYGTEI